MPYKIKAMDVVLIDDFKYIVYKYNKKNSELIPITNLLNSIECKCVIPKLLVDSDLLKYSKKIDNSDLYYLMDIENPLIEDVIRKFLKNGK